MNKRQIQKITCATAVLIISAIIYFTYKNFLVYKNTIIKQQIDHMHTTSESIGRSIALYVDEKEKALKVLGKLIQNGNVSESQRKILLKSYYTTYKDEISTICYIEDNLIQSFPKHSKDYFKNIPVGRDLKKRDNRFFLTMRLPLREGYLISEIDLDTMHSLIVKPIKVGWYGYAVLKDLDGEILMHPEHDHIGENMFDYRKSKYPDANLEEVLELREKERVERDGSYIYNSYWWGNDSLKEVKKISVFSRIKVVPNPWVVSMIISYDEVEDPIFSYLIQSIVVSLIVIFISIGIICFLAKVLTSKEKYKIEMKYLKALNKSNEKLRTKEAELYHSRRLESIGKLTRGISHEFNNILTPIMGYSEILLKILTPEDSAYKYSMGIHRSSKRAKDIIEQIRLFGGGKELSYKPLKIPELLREALELIKTTLPKNVILVSDISSDLGYIYGNETSIHQVILNICSNAISAMKDKTQGNLRIECRKTNLKKEMIKLSFIDDGCGMSPEVRNRIFDPFYTQKLNDKGSGIGLTIVQGIIEKHGGVIEVESQLGIGSSFHIYLPTTVIDKTNLKRKLGEMNGQERVLIVDDEPDIREFLSDGLKSFGYSTKEYERSTEVIRDIKKVIGYYDVVVTDLSMPEIGGASLARRLKEEGDIKIIIITASSHEPLEEYLNEGIIDDYLLKPVTSERVAESIRELLS